MPSQTLTLKNNIAVEHARDKLQERIDAADVLFVAKVDTWAKLHRERNEKKIWVDYTVDQLNELFVFPTVAQEFAKESKATATSGDILSYTQHEQRTIESATAFLRSVMQRLDFQKPPISKVQIPVPLIAVVADVIAAKYSHANIDFLMEKAGLTLQDFSGVNKVNKVRNYLRLANEGTTDAMDVLGKTIEEVMELEKFSYPDPPIKECRERITQSLAKYGMAYQPGGRIVAVGVATAAVRSFDALVRVLNVSTMQEEFERILKHVDEDPPTAVTASCALLEALFKHYIAEHPALVIPTKESIKPLWDVVRKDIGFDPSLHADEDLRKVLSGLGSIVDGIACLRTKKGSAHGHGKTQYKVKPRHARLLAHSASTLAVFILETWDENNKKATNP